MHGEPPPIPLVEGKFYSKSDKDIVKMKAHRNPTSITSCLYDFRMSLFENGNPEEFLICA